MARFEDQTYAPASRIACATPEAQLVMELGVIAKLNDDGSVREERRVLRVMVDTYQWTLSSQESSI